MILQELKEILCEEGYEGVLIFDNPDYADAFVGVSTSNRAIYDYDLIMSCLMKEENMSKEARDFIDHKAPQELLEKTLSSLLFLRRLDQ